MFYVLLAVKNEPETGLCFPSIEVCAFDDARAAAEYLTVRFGEEALANAIDCKEVVVIEGMEKDIAVKPPEDLAKRMLFIDAWSDNGSDTDS